MYSKRLRLAVFTAAFLLCAAGMGGADDFTIDTKIAWPDQGNVTKGKGCLFQSGNCTPYNTTDCYDADGNSSPKCTVGVNQPATNAGVKLHSAVQYGDCIDPPPGSSPTDPKCADPFNCAVVVLYRDVATMNSGGVITKTCSNPTCYRQIFNGGPRCEPGARVITYGMDYQEDQ